MASEDSNQVLPGRPPVHCLGDLCDLNQTAGIEMPAVRYQSHAACELFEVTLLGRSQRVGLEERNYRSHEILPPVDNELAQRLAMIVVPLGDVDTTYAEKALQLFQRGPAADTLCHDEPVRDLVSGLVASAACPTRLPDKPDGEATLSVYKASDPTCLD